MDEPVFAFPAKRSSPSDLQAAVRKARIEEAERSSAVAELRGAEAARLELLKDELAPVFAQLPADAALFDLGLVGGEKPRLFVDMVAFIELGRDRRTFRFIQDTRAGRLVLAESERVDPMVEAVTTYLGRRLVERERALAGRNSRPHRRGAASLSGTEESSCGASAAGAERPRVRVPARAAAGHGPDVPGRLVEGARRFFLAGPGRDQLIRGAHRVERAGIRVLRGAADRRPP